MDLKRLREIACVSQIKLALLSSVSRARLQQTEAGELELTHEEERRVRETLRSVIDAQIETLQSLVAR